MGESVNVCRASFDDLELYSLEMDGHWLTLRPHFRLGEFASRDGSDHVLLHPWLLDGLVELKAWADGAVVRINSGFRSKRHNEAVGGATESRHLWGLAADVDVLGKDPVEVADWANEEGWGGVGRYRTFTHLDVWGENRRWSLS